MSMGGDVTLAYTSSNCICYITLAQAFGMSMGGDVTLAYTSSNCTL